jgi:hypothetical protein
MGTIRVVIIIPGIIWVVIGSIIIILAIAESFIRVPVIQITPLVAVTDFHPEVTVLLVILFIPVTAIILFFHPYILILRTGRGIIYIVRRLACFICGCTTAERCNGECQE